MNNLFLEKTITTPKVDFQSSGKMSIAGSLLPEDPKTFFDQIFDWIEDTKANKIIFDIRINYINTSSSKRIIEVIKLIDRSEKFEKIELNWHYEADDSDMLEYGELIQRDLKRVNINYVECDDLNET